MDHSLLARTGDPADRPSAESLALDDGDSANAELAFSRAAAIAKSAQLPGLEAEALLKLTYVFLDNGHPNQAAQAINRGLEVTQGGEDGYDLPLFVAAQALLPALSGVNRLAGNCRSLSNHNRPFSLPFQPGKSIGLLSFCVPGQGFVTRMLVKLPGPIRLGFRLF